MHKLASFRERNAEEPVKEMLIFFEGNGRITAISTEKKLRMLEIRRRVRSTMRNT